MSMGPDPIPRLRRSQALPFWRCFLFAFELCGAPTPLSSAGVKHQRICWNRSDSPSAIVLDHPIVTGATPAIQLRAVTAPVRSPRKHSECSSAYRSSGSGVVVQRRLDESARRRSCRARLQSIKRAVDPDRLFDSPQALWRAATMMTRLSVSGPEFRSR